MSPSPLWPRVAGVVLVALAVRVPLMLGPGFPADQFQFQQWATMSRWGGLASVYELRPYDPGRRWCNYPPGYLYVLRGLAEVERQLATDEGQTAVLYKMPAVLADALLAALLLIWLHRRTGARWATAAGAGYALAPSVIHNAAVWMQMDALPALLVVASLEAARRKKIGVMAVLAAAAAMTKPQALVIAPVWVVATVFWAQRDLARWLRVIASALLTLVALLLPFRNALGGVWDAYAAAGRYYPFTHLNGFSAWFLLNPLIEADLQKPLAMNYVRDDLTIWSGLSARTLGLMGLAVVGVCVIAVLRRRQCDEPSLRWSARLLPLAFFVLATQMHERYLFLALATWTWACLPKARWAAGWLLLGLCAALNVLWTWPGPPGAGWAAIAGGLLHRAWLGVAPGTWCAVGLCGLLAVSACGWIDGFRPWQRVETGADVDGRRGHSATCGARP